MSAVCATLAQLQMHKCKLPSLTHHSHHVVACCCCLLQLLGSKWWVDESNNWAHSHHEARERHSAPKMTLEALKKDIVLRS